MIRQMKTETEFPEVYNLQMQILLECMSICVACGTKCLEEGHKKTAALCFGCSEICTIAVKAASGESVFKPEIMELCAKACKKCGQECKKMKPKHCQECAELCSLCSKVCSE